MFPVHIPTTKKAIQFSQKTKKPIVEQKREVTQQIKPSKVEYKSISKALSRSLDTIQLMPKKASQV